MMTLRAVADTLWVIQDAVSSTIQRKDNEQFLDTFRYSIITSNLLHEHTGTSTLRLGSVHRKDSGLPESDDVANWTLDGAVVAITIPAAASWMLKWSLSASSIWIALLRLGLLCVLLYLTKELLDAHSRRQRLYYLRQEVVKGINVAVINLDAFDKSSAAAITLIQEVEAVSRGYHL
jgi:Mysoin-binding motif of peroxisomes